MFILLCLLALFSGALSQEDDIEAQWKGRYYCVEGRDVIVHLFEWKWADIEKECPWLAQVGYCAVQVSQPSEHRVIDGWFPWYQRYQPVSYILGSRSGNREEFTRMVETCNNHGVFIYVDAVINHMTGGGWGVGSAGSQWSGDDEWFPAVPYYQEDGHFHGSDVCGTGNLEIWDYNNITEVRFCRLLGLRDLRGDWQPVRDRVVEYMNDLISIGVAGFRIDAAKHMHPNDLRAMLWTLRDLNTRWFPANRRAYVYQEVIELGRNGHGIMHEYFPIGRVTEFRAGVHLGEVFRKQWGQRLSFLSNWGTGWGLMNGIDAVTFTDNHDNQRGHGGGGESVLTFRNAGIYKAANAFQLAWPYGHVRIMSSYYWEQDWYNGKDQNDWVGPPSHPGGVTKDVDCFNGEWMCEHRWREIYNMVTFHNVVLGEPVMNWWDNGQDLICFSRGDKGFIAISNEYYDVIGRSFFTGMADGDYCDVAHCDGNRPPCTGDPNHCQTIRVRNGGWATFNIYAANYDPYYDPVVAIHV